MVHCKPHREFDPITDCYLVRFFENRTMCILAEGSEWGDLARLGSWSALNRFAEVASRFRVNRSSRQSLTLAHDLERRAEDHKAE